MWKIINDSKNVTINNDISFNLNNIKKSLSFIPLQSLNNDFIFWSFMRGIEPDNGSFDLYVGNKISYVTTSMRVW